MKAACGAFSPDGQQLAVGMRCGGIKVFEFHPETRQVSPSIASSNSWQWADTYCLTDGCPALPSRKMLLTPANDNWLAVEWGSAWPLVYVALTLVQLNVKVCDVYDYYDFWHCLSLGL